jgi:hypothetical protein
VDDTGQVIADEVELDGIFEPGRERGHGLVRVVPGPVEPPGADTDREGGQPGQQPAGRRARVAGGDRVLKEAGQARLAGASPRQMISIARSSVTGAAGNVAAA